MMPNDIANNMADTIHQLEKELKDLREENKVLMQECDRLIKEKGTLLKQHEQIAEYKRLLKAAVEDMSEIKSYLSEPYSHLCDKWRYADEALKLIGGSEK